MLFSCDFSWGCWTGYFGKDYMPLYDYSGSVKVEKGTIIAVERIEFPFDEWGPLVHSRVYHPMEGTAFTSEIHNSFDGVRVAIEGSDESILTLETRMGVFSFTAGELFEKKHLSMPVGERYSLAVIHAESDEPWYYEKFPGEECIYRSGDFSGGYDRDWFGIRGRAIPPGGRITLHDPEPLKKTGQKDGPWRFRFRLRFLINGDEVKERAIRGTPRFSVYLNGRLVKANTRFSTYHDTASQFIEELFFTITDPPEHTENVMVIENQDPELSLLIPLMGILRTPVIPLEITGVPQWALVGSPAVISLRINSPAANIDIRYDPELLDFSISPETVSSRPMKKKIGDLNLMAVNEAAVRVLAQGDYRFHFIIKRRLPHIRITFTDKWTGDSVAAELTDIYEVPPEGNRCLVGAELRCGNPGEYITLLKRFRDEQIADLAVFRDYHNDPGQPEKLWEAAAFCRQNGMAVDAVIMDEEAVVAHAAADACICVGPHEQSGIFYGRDKVRNQGNDMKEAAEISVELLRQVADAFRVKGFPVALGDASGGSRYVYMAGFDIIRHETFVGHHMLILPNARGAARVFKKDCWGVHIASQHNAQPELEYGIRRFFAGVYLSWIMGAAFLYEEDSQFGYFKSEKMTGGDFLPASKNRIMRDFYRYNRTHPRRGRPIVTIAVLQGRYAPPISGIGTANNGDPSMDASKENYPVWSHLGNLRWSWGYRQCEKGLHLLEIVSPGICLSPLHQRSEKVRRFFSGSPYGEFDFLPIEGSLEDFSSYRLILMLDWHTMEKETGDYEKFKNFAVQGGVLFLSVPHLTVRRDREMLIEMKDLRLYNNGGVEDLSGVCIKGVSETEFTYPCPVNEWKDLTIPDYEGLRLPNQNEEEDGPCRLADMELKGAVPLINDASGKPLLVRYQLGKGFVYTLCTYAYPGHEMLKSMMPQVIIRLLELHGKGPVSFSGNKNDVNDIYYSLWGEDGRPDKLYVLNTDWTREKNIKKVFLNAGDISTEVNVSEGALTEITLLKDGVLFAENGRSDVSITLLRRERGKAAYGLFALREALIRIISAVDIHAELNGKILRPETGGEGGRKQFHLPAGFNELRVSE
ncbi:MAG: hypothetical protein LBC60_01625 [Spirochaetaceae bacterium]|jgi:hypothetical protein|nr:hypothetical protein [Spirochaetaceae bacterium]